MRAARFVPALDWLPRYQRQDLRADALAGLTTAAMLVPQGMGYAMLAGLPPIVGLYASTLPLLAYALLGTSRQLAVGPVAMDSLLVALAVGAIAETGTDAYLAHAVTLALMVGVMQFVLGVIGLGFVANFLSRPVLSGFTSAAALIIGFNQLRHALALDLPRTHDVLAITVAALTQVDAWHVTTLAIAVLSLVALVVLKKQAPRFPRALGVVVIAGAAVALGDLAASGVAVVGQVPEGLPRLTLPRFDTATLGVLLPAAATISLIAFVEAISVGKHFARLGRYRVRPGQELIALGAANVTASLVGGYPITGGFSRTAVNAQAGARTPLSGVVTAAAIAATLLLLTPLFRHVPNAVLAAIIGGAVIGLFDASEARRLWRVKRNDFWLLFATFALTLTLGIQWGVLAGAGLSLVLFLYAMARPHFAVLGQVPGSETYLNVERHPHVVTHPGILVVRIDAQFFFANVSFLRETLERLEAERSDPLRAIVLDASGINQLDSSAEAALWELDRDYGERDVTLVFSHVKGPVRDVMHRTGLLARLNETERVFFRTHDAVEHLRGRPLRSPRTTTPHDRRAPADRIGCGPSPKSTDGAEEDREEAILTRGAWI